MAYVPDDSDAIPTPPPWEEGSSRPSPRPKRRATRGRRSARKRRGVPWWAWMLVILGWLGALAVVGVAAWFVLGPGAQTSLPMGDSRPAAVSPSPLFTPETVLPTATETFGGGVEPSPTHQTPMWTPEDGAASPSPTLMEADTGTVTWTPSVVPIVTATATVSPTFTATWTPLPTPSPEPTPTLPPTLPPSPTPIPEDDTAPPEPLPESEMVLLVPFYVYPSWWDPNQYLWDDLAQARQRVSIVAIINPNEGPGSGPPNPDYRRGMDELLSAGVVMVGYVPTEYGERPSEAVRLDVNLYADYFPVQGIFFDEVPTDPTYLNRYRLLYEYARTFFPEGPVIFNYGTLPPQGYLDIGALNVVFEDEAAQWWLFDPSQAFLDFETSGILVHSASLQDMQAILQEVRTQQWAKYVYFTDDTPPNPWDSLPSYWEDLLNALAP